MQNDDRAQRLEIHKTPIWEDEPEDFFGDTKVAYVHEPQVPPEDRPRESNYVLEPGTAHYKPVHEDTPGPASIGEPRGEILRLAQKVTDRIGHAVTTSDPEYWGLAAFVTPEMAHVANRMDVRVPYTLPQLMKLTGKSEAYLQPLLYEMSVRGLIEYNWENPKHEKQWILLPFVPGSAEFAVMNQAQLRDHPELATFFNRMTFLPLEKVTPMVPPGGAGIGMHVIPVERAISMENEAVDLERISYWLDKYEGRYSIGACSCRVCEQVRGDGCADDAQGWCIGLGDMAQYSIETGKGRYATREEVMEVLRRAEENGFVHQVTNIDGAGKIFAICNCNVNICYALRTSQLFNTPNMSRSAYVAEVDQEKCVACAGCVEVCPAGAPQLGQKIPTLKGCVKYPRQPLPDDLPWGPHMWDPDYRDNNRIETHDTGTAPCKVACPAHVPVQGYLRKAAEGKYQEALMLIKWENPFPAVCGRVCNKRCEAACTRGTVDDPIAIDDVKRFVADFDLNAETRVKLPVQIPSLRGPWKNKIAIIGAGPAGLTCAFYLAQKGYSPTVFEKNERPGGMLTYGIPSYKLGKDVVDAEIECIREMGVEIRCGIEVGKDVTLQQLRDEGFEAFYLAVGAQGGRLAGVSGEDAAGVVTAVGFLREALAGTRPDMSGTTVVVGGGNVAVDAARTSVRCGSDNVTMFCLEQRDEMPALPNEVAEAEEDGVAVSCGWGPKEILVEDGRATGVVFKRCVRCYDEDGRFAPVYDEDDTITVACDHVVMSIGQAIEWGGLLEGSKVELGGGGRVLADAKTYQTAEPDVFAGGDAYTGPRFVIDAIAAGHEAAVSIHRFVQKDASLTIGRNQRHYVELDKENLAIGDYDKACRQMPSMIPSDDPAHDWRDRSLALTEEQIRTECARCLSCGASIVDPNKCIGCGLCTTRCEFDAIHLHRTLPEATHMVRSEDKIKEVLPYAAKREVRILKRKLQGK